MSGFRSITERVPDPDAARRAAGGRPVPAIGEVAPPPPVHQARPAPSATSQTSTGLREMLFAELISLREGRSDPKRAMAVARLAGGIIDTVKAELAHAAFMRDAKPGEAAPAPLHLTGGPG